ncbi:MAG: hypothetical protein ACR2NP_18260, partial [Pirellulaceae bacterium]
MNDNPEIRKSEIKPVVGTGQANTSFPAVGRTIPHDSAIGHVTGTAPYIDDLPWREDELAVSFVG